MLLEERISQFPDEAIQQCFVEGLFEEIESIHDLDFDEDGSSGSAYNEIAQIHWDDDLVEKCGLTIFDVATVFNWMGMKLDTAKEGILENLASIKTARDIAVFMGKFGG